jgi:hypothetical protein
MVTVASRSQANGSSPLQSFFHMYFSGLEAMGQAYDPFVKTFARGQIELLSFMSRRAQAYIELPGRLTHCRTPQDVLDEQKRFWDTTVHQYTTSANRIADALSPLTGTPFHFSLPGDEAQDVRDYITFPEPQEQQTNAGRVRERKVA